MLSFQNNNSCCNLFDCCFIVFYWCIYWCCWYYCFCCFWCSLLLLLLPLWWLWSVLNAPRLILFKAPPLVSGLNSRDISACIPLSECKSMMRIIARMQIVEYWGCSLGWWVRRWWRCCCPICVWRGRVISAHSLLLLLLSLSLSLLFLLLLLFQLDLALLPHHHQYDWLLYHF